ncbi:unnamed protein product, partial [Pleuronectes platessa]
SHLWWGGQVSPTSPFTGTGSVAVENLTHQEHHWHRQQHSLPPRGAPPVRLVSGCLTHSCSLRRGGARALTPTPPSVTCASRVLLFPRYVRRVFCPPLHWLPELTEDKQAQHSREERTGLGGAALKGPVRCHDVKPLSAADSERRPGEVFTQNCGETCEWIYGRVSPSSLPHAWSIVNRKRLTFSLTPCSLLFEQPFSPLRSHHGQQKEVIYSLYDTQQEAKRKETTAVTVTHVPTIVHNGTAKVTLPSAIQIVNGSGALPMLKTPITQVVSVVQTRNFHQSAPITVSSNMSSSSSKNLPKVMIPLSSIPTYSASMDSSSFLKTSFSKFPYPTKAELCYLTVVTKFPEEQIKIWFTAQRLKQGISWSPEEIEEARRKMFNTIIQTAPSNAHNHIQSHHSPAQHTFTVLPASLGATGIPHILQGSLVSQAGVIVTQPMMANGIQLSSTPLALAVTPKPQAAARPMMQARPAAALVADKGISMVVGTVGSSSTLSNIISSSSRSGGGGTKNSIVSSSQASVINLSLGSSNHSNGRVSGVNAPPGSTPGSGTPVSAFLDPSFNKSKKSQVQLSALKDSFQGSQFPDQEEVDRLIARTGLTVREVRKWFSDRRYHFRNLKGVRTSTGAQNSKSGTVTGSGSGLPGSGAAGSANPVDLSESSSSSGAKTPQHGSAPLSPTATQTPTSPNTPSRRLPRQPSEDFTAIRYKEREPHQLKALEASFAEDPDPSGEEVDRLRSETKMTRREIHGWFAERRKKAAAEKKKEEADRALREEEVGVDGEERQKEDSSGELKVNPIKINLKMLKVTETSGKAEGEGLESSALPLLSSSTPASSPGSAPSSTPKPSQFSTLTPKPSNSPKPTAIRGKKTAEQLHLLKQVYARTQWPSAAQYDELISASGLPRPEVVRWFGDSRYVQKNGQLKWLESYQTMALEEELQTENTQILQAHLDVHGRAEETQLQGLADESGLTTDLVRHWFATKASLPQTEQTVVTGPGPVAPGVAAEPQTTGSSPLESEPGGGTEEKMEQSVCGVATEPEEANTDETVNPTKGTD